MQLLIAHREATSRLALTQVLEGLFDGDLEVIQSGDGMETVDKLLAADSPALAVVDWDLPGCDGPELCRLVRAYHLSGPPYIILLARSDYRLAEGLEAGADDCVHTPVKGDELRARLNVGRRFAALPWAGLSRAAALSAQCSPNGEDLDGDFFLPDGERLELATERRSSDDDRRDALADFSERKFELQSVLVPH